MSKTQIIALYAPGVERVQSFKEYPQSMATSTTLLKQTPSASPDTTSREYDGLHLFLRDINLRLPQLNNTEQANGIRETRSDDDIEALILANIPLVIKIAHEHENRGVSLGDLISEGIIGLTKAVEKYDPTHGTKISTYAAYWIKRGINLAIAEQSGDIRIPPITRWKAKKIKRETTNLTEELDRPPSTSEIASRAKLSEKKVLSLQKCLSSGRFYYDSIHAPLDNDPERTLADTIPDSCQTSPDEDVDRQNLLSKITNLLDSPENDLTANEQTVIRLRHGLNKEHEELNLAQIGRLIGVSRERARVIQNNAYAKLRKAIKKGAKAC